MSSLARVIDQPTTRIVRPETEDGSGSITSRSGSFQASSASSGVSPCLAMYSPRWLQSISPTTITQLYYGRITKPSTLGLRCAQLRAFRAELNFLPGRLLGVLVLDGLEWTGMRSSTSGSFSRGTGYIFHGARLKPALTGSPALRR